jgi:adenylate cyclase
VGRNIEIKARASDFGGQSRAAAGLAGGDPEVLAQEDTFFGTRRGRLKLRKFAGDRGELIYYERDDSAGPAESHYMLLPTREPDALATALKGALGVRGVVRKRRTVYMVGRTRVHLDEVEGLGEFIELEVVMDGPAGREGDETASGGAEPEDGEAEAARLMAELGITEDDLIETSYIDLILERGEGE